MHEKNCELFVANFWDPIEKRIKEKDHLYYAGGTLFVDNKDRPGGIALNLDGAGFSYSSHAHLKETKLYMPKYILVLVRELYIEICGETDHYKEEVSKNSI